MEINFPELSNGYFRLLSSYIMNTEYMSSLIFFYLTAFEIFTA